MNATSFFSLETPAGAVVPPAAEAAGSSAASTSGDADVFAALVDEALVRAAQGRVDLPALLPAAKPAGAAQPATASGLPLPELPAAAEAAPVVDGEDASTSAESPEPEPPQAEPAQDLNILLLSQSLFVAPTLPVTWVVPKELTAASAEKTGDEPPPVGESAVQGETRSSREMVEPARGSPERTGSFRTALYGVGVPPQEAGRLMRTGEVPLTAGEPAGSSSAEPKNAKSREVDAPTPIAGPARSVLTGNGGRLDLVELGFQPAAEVDLPLLTEAPEVSVPTVSTPTLPAAKSPEPVSLKVEVEAKSDGAVARPQSLPVDVRSTLLEAQPPPVQPSPVQSPPVAKMTLPTPAPLPDVPAVTASALRFTTGSGEPVQTWPVVAEQGTPAVAVPESELPVASEEAAIVAPSGPQLVVQNSAPKKSQTLVEAHVGAGLVKVEGAPVPGLERRGTSAAKEELRMESLSNAEQLCI